MWARLFIVEMVLIDTSYMELINLILVNSQFNIFQVLVCKQRRKITSTDPRHTILLFYCGNYVGLHSERLIDNFYLFINFTLILFCLLVQFYAKKIQHKILIDCKNSAGSNFKVIQKEEKYFCTIVINWLFFQYIIVLFYIIIIFITV